ncbi:hypothetical protein LCGC14_1954360, partial [marine sediment metagenome]
AIEGEFPALSGLAVKWEPSTCPKCGLSPSSFLVLDEEGQKAADNECEHGLPIELCSVCKEDSE